jgi:hypothetical protein
VTRVTAVFVAAGLLDALAPLELPELLEVLDAEQAVTVSASAATAAIDLMRAVLFIGCPSRFRGVRHGVFEREDVPAPA